MPSQNLQDAFLNSARKERLPVTIYLTSGVKLSGRVRGFDKYCVVFETNHQEQLIFKHAISTVVTPRAGNHGYASHSGQHAPAGGRQNGGDHDHESQPGVPRQPGEAPRPAVQSSEDTE